MLRELVDQRAAAAEKMARIVAAAERRSLTRRQASDFEEAAGIFDDLGEQLWFFGAEQVRELDPAAAAQRATELVAVDRTVGWESAERRMQTPSTQTAPVERAAPETATGIPASMPRDLPEEHVGTRMVPAIRLLTGPEGVMPNRDGILCAETDRSRLMERMEVLSGNTLSAAQSIEFHRLDLWVTDLSDQITYAKERQRENQEALRRLSPPPPIGDPDVD